MLPNGSPAPCSPSALDQGTPDDARPHMVTIAQALRDGADRLATIADNPRLEARLLLAHALGVPQTDLIRDLRRSINTSLYNHLVARRQAREPVALILGRREFWSMEFQVSAATLIPRADSETLIEAALTAFEQRSPPLRVLDLGTGTGCLLLALLREFPGAFGIGVDINPAAAMLGQCNARRLGLEGRSAFVCGDWTNSLDGRFDLLVCNPPYVATSQIGRLMPEVACYEPRRALDGGEDGSDAYRKILPQIGDLVSGDSVAILEVGAKQAELTAELARQSGFECSFRHDLAGLARAIVLYPRSV